jgi:hypothetical protein
MTTWEQKAHEIIAELSFAASKAKNFNVTKNKWNVTFRPVTLPDLVHDLVKWLGHNNREVAEHEIKCILLYKHQIEYKI